MCAVSPTLALVRCTVFYSFISLGFLLSFLIIFIDYYFSVAVSGSVSVALFRFPHWSATGEMPAQFHVHFYGHSLSFIAGKMNSSPKKEEKGGKGRKRERKRRREGKKRSCINNNIEYDDENHNDNSYDNDNDNDDGKRWWLRCLCLEYRYCPVKMEYWFVASVDVGAFPRWTKLIDWMWCDRVKFVPAGKREVEGEE